MQSIVQGRCPYCEREIQYLYQTENIPFFSDILIVSGRCECGYRHADTMVLGESEPARWELAVEGPEELAVRVVTCEIENRGWDGSALTTTGGMLSWV